MFNYIVLYSQISLIMPNLNLSLFKYEKKFLSDFHFYNVIISCINILLSCILFNVTLLKYLFNYLKFFCYLLIYTEPRCHAYFIEVWFPLVEIALLRFRWTQTNTFFYYFKMKMKYYATSNKNDFIIKYSYS